jgi:hypothetical protein
MQTIKQWFEWAKEQVYEDKSRLYPWAEEALELCTVPDEKANSLSDALLGGFPFILGTHNWGDIHTDLEKQNI